MSSSLSKDYLATGSGKIMFLPEREMLSPGEGDIPSDADIPYSVFNHPVVVLSPQEDECKEVDFVVVRFCAIMHLLYTNCYLTREHEQLTSLGGTDLRERYGEKEFFWGGYLPIWPSNPHPDTQELLHLTQESNILEKQSYVNISKSYTISMRHLRPFRVYRFGCDSDTVCRLTESSFNLMKGKIGKGTVTGR
ncbi:hypothetical protein GQ53DRAFT_849304 [Thozetella sp. PMI_491]|nr:hypothetical protein GQ53DRAFT_849304 [Thozetella sp. PMI_491]